MVEMDVKGLKIGLQNSILFYCRKFNKKFINWFCMVERRLALSPHSKKLCGFNPVWGFSVWSVHVLPVHA